MGVGVGVDVDSILAKQVSSDSRWQGCGVTGVMGSVMGEKEGCPGCGRWCEDEGCWVARTRVARTGQVRVSVTDFSVSTALGT